MRAQLECGGNMRKIIVNGGHQIYGDVQISGMKNAALPVIFASILANGVSVIDNIPPVSDVYDALELLSELGAKIAFHNKTCVEIDTTDFDIQLPSAELTGKMRASAYLLGAELGRFGRAEVGWPGGCDFGIRPLDLHRKGFEALGAKVWTKGAAIYVDAPEGLNASYINLRLPSVGATVNIILASVLANGVTQIVGAAREPHIIDLVGYLNSCGADIRGAGTDTIKIYGVRSLHGANYKILPDMIEAGTFMTAVAACGGKVNVRSVVPKHLESIAGTLISMNVGVEFGSDFVTVTSNGYIRPAEIQTDYYPGLPTDMHPQFGTLMALADGTGRITDKVLTNRFKYVEQLQKMGAHIEVTQPTAEFVGGELGGAAVTAVDLRAGAALIVAGLAASGTTVISNIELIERGYYNIIGKFKALGADIYMRDDFSETETLSGIRGMKNLI